MRAIFYFSEKLVQWKLRTGLILLAFSWISEQSQLYHLLNVFCSCVHSRLLARDGLTILVEHGWCYGVWRAELLELI